MLSERAYAVLEQACMRFFLEAITPIQFATRFLLRSRYALCLNSRFHREYLRNCVTSFERGQRSSERVMILAVVQEAVLMSPSARLLRYPCVPPWWRRFEVSNGLEVNYGILYSYVSGLIGHDPSHPMWTAVAN